MKKWINESISQSFFILHPYFLSLASLCRAALFLAARSGAASLFRARSAVHCCPDFGRPLFRGGFFSRAFFLASNGSLLRRAGLLCPRGLSTRARFFSRLRGPAFGGTISHGLHCAAAARSALCSLLRCLCF